MTDALGFGEKLATAATVFVPETLADPVVACFALPGGGYSRGYFSFDVPGASGGGQAGWHTGDGWIFVTCDLLGVGDSDVPSDPRVMTFDNIAAANHATVVEVLSRLREGTLAPGLASIPDVTVLGIGQSLGGCVTIVQQGRHDTYDGTAVLGFSAIQTALPGIPSAPDLSKQRGESLPSSDELNDVLDEVLAASGGVTGGDPDLPPMARAFHYDDEPIELVRQDLDDFPRRGGRDLPWAAASIPACVAQVLSPGVVAVEAALITSPVLIAVGERDVCPDPWSEPRGYRQSTDITVYQCPRMSHMHNFAGTREQLWRRIGSWGGGVAAQRVVAGPPASLKA